MVPVLVPVLVLVLVLHGPWGSWYGYVVWVGTEFRQCCLLSTYVYLRLTATYLGTMVTRRVGRPRRIYSLESRRVSRGTVGSTGWSRVRVAATQTTGGLVVTLRCFPGFERVWGMGHVVMRSDGSWRMCWIRRLPV